MGLIRSGADCLRWYLSGASSDGGSQSNPHDSRGKFRASSEVESLGWSVDGAGLQEVEVDFVAGRCGAGVGVLEAVSSSELTWMAPGSVVPGAAVAVPANESRVLEDGEERGAYIRVSRDGSADLAGQLEVESVDLYDNVVGGRRVTSAERAAGVVQYRLVVLRNEHVSTGLDVRDVVLRVLPLLEDAVGGGGFEESLGGSGAGEIVLSAESFAGWPAAGWALVVTSAGAVREAVYYGSRSEVGLDVAAAGRGLLGTSAAAMEAGDTVLAWPGIALALEAPNAQPSGHFNGDSLDAPSGLTWEFGLGDGVDGGDLGWGDLLGVWIRFDVPAGAAGAPEAPLRRVRVEFDV